jgi:putative redox protein
VRAAVDHLQAGGYPGVDPGRIAVVGHSFGGWAAVLAAAADQRLRAVVTCGAPAELGAVAVPPAALDGEFTRFLATTPGEFLAQLGELGTRPGPLDVVASVSPRPLLVIHGSDDEWIPAEQGRLLYERAGAPRRYVEIEGANHAFAWHRAALRAEITGWLADVWGGSW